MVTIDNTNTEFLNIDSGWTVFQDYSFCTDTTSFIRLDFTGNIEIYFRANNDCGYVNIYFDDEETPAKVYAGGGGLSMLIYSKTFDDDRVHRIRICNYEAKATAFDYFVVSGEAVPYGSYESQSGEPEEPENHAPHYLAQTSSLKAVADAIRAKTGGTDPLMFPDGMTEAIAGITGGEDLDAELANQDELIEQIMTAIEGKVAGGGGGVPSVFAINGISNGESYAGAYTTGDSMVIE